MSTIEAHSAELLQIKHSGRYLNPLVLRLSAQVNFGELPFFLLLLAFLRGQTQAVLPHCVLVWLSVIRILFQTGVLRCFLTTFGFTTIVNQLEVQVKLASRSFEAFHHRLNEAAPLKARFIGLSRRLFWFRYQLVSSGDWFRSSFAHYFIKALTSLSRVPRFMPTVEAKLAFPPQAAIKPAAVN